MQGLGTPPVAGVDLAARLLGLPGIEAIRAHAGTITALSSGRPQLRMPARVHVR
jgi:hypothetical protein